MNFVQNAIARADAFQQAHAWAAFPYGVVKKYGDDNASYHGAAITYYAFLALFPLLFAFEAVLKLTLRGDAHLQTKLLNGVNQYFPLLGRELQSNITTNVGKTSLALTASVIVAVIGARGVADAVRRALDEFWHVAPVQRAGFPKGALKSLGMIIFGGGVLVIAAVLSGYATSLGHSAGFKLLATFISLVLIIFGIFLVLTFGASAKHTPRRALLISAVVAGVGMQILQSFGGYLITHELKNLSTPYGAFSIALALLFWIYLQVEVLLYAIEAGVVKSRGLWPRSIVGNDAASRRHAA
ncbi:MAG TPA: YihY/virulence factor BrkB family protein [Candidatus Saccharimonadales bacterium]